MNIERLTTNIVLDEIFDHNDPVFRHMYEVYDLCNKNSLLKPYEIVQGYFKYVFIGNFLYKLHNKIMLKDVYTVKYSEYDFYITFRPITDLKSCGKVNNIGLLLKKIKIFRDTEKEFKHKFQQSSKILDKVKQKYEQNFYYK